MTLSIDQKGWSGGSGSLENTSMQAPAMVLFSKASINATSSTTDALAILMKSADDFMAWNCSLPKNFSVSGVEGRAAMTMSAVGNISMSCSSVYTWSANISVDKCFFTAKIWVSKTLALCAMARPILPKPTIKMVFPKRDSP